MLVYINIFYLDIEKIFTFHDFMSHFRERAEISAVMVVRKSFKLGRVIYHFKAADLGI